MSFLGYENIYDFYWDWYMGVNVSMAEDLDEFGVRIKSIHKKHVLLK